MSNINHKYLVAAIRLTWPWITKPIVFNVEGLEKHTHIRWIFYFMFISTNLIRTTYKFTKLDIFITNIQTFLAAIKNEGVVTIKRCDNANNNKNKWCTKIARGCSSVRTGVRRYTEQEIQIAIRCFDKIKGNMY